MWIDFRVPKSASSLCWKYHPGQIEPHLSTEYDAAIHKTVRGWRHLCVTGVLLF
jgi:hypothetical protein